MVAAYVRLHELGLAHAFEAWEGDELVGGLYGVSLGATFFGESMFSTRPDASKVAFARSVEYLSRPGHHAHRLPGPDRAPGPLRRGGVAAARASWTALAIGVEAPTRRGRWVLEAAAPIRP